MYCINDSTMQLSNFDILPRPTSNCDFLYLCRLENLEDALAEELYMGDWTDNKVGTAKAKVMGMRKMSDERKGGYNTRLDP